MPPRLLLTGASGFLGRRVHRRAVAAGWEVVAPGRGELDVGDGEAIRATVAAVGALGLTAVVHTAYVARGPHLDAVTARAPGVLAAAAADGGARFVHVSSDVVFAGGPDAYDEAAPASPVHDYGRAKAAAEAAVQAAHPEAVVARTSLLVGDGDGPGPQEALAADPGTRCFVDEWRRPVAAGDVADALVRLTGGANGDAAAEVGGIVHLVGPELLSRYELACRLAPRGLAPTPGRQAELPGTRPGRLDVVNTRLPWWDPAPVPRARSR